MSGQEQIVSTIQRVKTKDGYQTIFPINTTRDVYYKLSDNLDDSITLQKYLETSFIPKSNSSIDGDGTITTFRDVYSGAVNGTTEDTDIRINLPIKGTTAGVPFTLDMSIGADERVMLNNLNSHKVEEFMANETSGLNTVICSSISSLGTNLIISGRGNGAEVRAYKIIDNALKVMTISPEPSTEIGRVELCALSDDGQYMALYGELNELAIYTKTDDLTYTRIGQLNPINVSTDITNLDNLTILDPNRTSSSSTNRQLFIMLGGPNRAAALFSFDSLGSFSQLKEDFIPTYRPYVVTTSTDSSTMVIAAKTGASTPITYVYIYTFNSETAQYILRYSSALSSLVNNSSGDIQSISLRPDGAMVSFVLASNKKVIYRANIVNGTIPTNDVKGITLQHEVVIHNHMQDDNILASVIKEYNTFNPVISVFNVSTGESVYNTDNIDNLFKNPASNIGLSANKKYGFIIKQKETTTEADPYNNEPQIVPFEFGINELVPSIGTNPSQMVVGEHCVVSKNGMYLAVLPSRSGSEMSNLTVYKTTGGSYLKINDTILNTTNINANDATDIIMSPDGMVIAVVLSRTIHVFYNLGNDVFLTETATMSQSDITCAAISNKTTRGYAMFMAGISGAAGYLITATSVKLTVAGAQSSAPSIFYGIPTGMCIHDNKFVYVSSYNATNQETRIERFVLIDSGTMNTSATNMGTLPEAPKKLLLNTTENGYVYAIKPPESVEDGSSLIGMWMATNNVTNPSVEIILNGLDISDTSYITFDKSNRYLYALSSNRKTIRCYSISTPDNIVNELTLTLVSEYSSKNMIGVKRLFVSTYDDRLVAYSSLFPYVFVFNHTTVSGLSDLKFSGTIMANPQLDESGNQIQAALWANTSANYDNTQFIKSVYVGTNEDLSGYIIIELNSFGLTNASVYIRELSLYRQPDESIDYSNISVEALDLTNTNLENLEIVNMTPSTTFRNIDVSESLTVDGCRVVTLNRVRGFVLSPGSWNEETIIENGATIQHHRYRIYNDTITPDSIVNIDIVDNTSLAISVSANVKSITVEGDGYVDIFAYSKPTGDIIVDINIMNN